MLNTVLLLLLFLLCVLICGVFAAAGFFIGVKIRFSRKEKPSDENELTAAQKKKAERELANLMSYNGDIQE